MSFPSPITSLKLRILRGSNTYEQLISSASNGNNTIQITNSNLINEFNNQPSGTIFTPSIIATYQNSIYPSGNDVSTSSLSNYVPNKITPSLSLSDIPDKVTTDAPFSLVPFVTKTGTGVLSYSSSNTSVATVNSSTGQVTIVGAGTTTLTVSLAASADQVYTSATPVSKNLIVASSWVQRGADIDGEIIYDFSGIVSLSADGTIVAIGAYGNDENGDRSGHVRVYKYDANKTTAQLNQSLPNFGPVGWNRLGQDIDGEASDDYSGASVTLSADGTILAIGAFGNNEYAGHVRVYKYDANKTTAQLNQSLPNFGPVGWNRLGQDIDSEAMDDLSGGSVSLSADGTILAIGAVYNDGNGDKSGHVRVYKYDANKTTAQPDQSLPNFGPVGWNRLGNDIDGEASNDLSGIVSLSADGTILAIGAHGNDANGSNSGHVRVYKYDANKTTAQLNQSLPNFGPVGWNRLGEDIDGEAMDDYSGYSISLSADGTILAIGAYANNPNVNAPDAGHVRVYKYDANKTTAQLNPSLSNFGPVGWNRLGEDIDGEATGDRSGYSLSLSADGTILAIGADANNPNVNAPDAGHVRIYKYDANKTTAQPNPSLPNFGPVGWNRLNQDIDGEASNDRSGYSVSLSADGTIVAIGAYANHPNVNALYAGHVRVYKYQ